MRFESMIEARRIRACAIRTCAFLAVFAGGCCDTPLQKKAAIAHELLRPALISEPQLSAYLQAVGRRLAAGGRAARVHSGDDDVLDGTIRIELLAGAQPFLNTTGVGRIYLSTTLFRDCQSEDDLAAQLAHAYGHLYARHLDSKDLACVSDPLKVSYEFATHPFTASEELRAEELGFQFYAYGGWNPVNFSRLPRARSIGGAKSFVSEPELMRAPIADARTFKRLREKATRLAAQGSRGGDSALLLRALPNCVAVDSPAAAIDELAGRIQSGDPDWRQDHGPKAQR